MKLKKKFKVLAMGALLVLTLGSVIGCTSKTENEGQESKENQESQATEYKNIDAKATEKLLEENKDLLIVDVRTPEEYAEGHIENAINIPSDDFESRLEEMESHKDKTVLLYCRTGNRSEKAAKVLADKGFKDTQNATEGIEEHEYKLVK